MVVSVRNSVEVNLVPGYLRTVILFVESIFFKKHCKIFDPLILFLFQKEFRYKINSEHFEYGNVIFFSN